MKFNNFLMVEIVFCQKMQNNKKRKQKSLEVFSELIFGSILCTYTEGNINL